ncbi:MAG: ATP-binding protein [Campylobacterota bacterium]|nr:ATP-binding protein [Campylobacterota bacterium]
MISFINQFVTKTIKRQLIVSFALILGAMMSLFIVYFTNNQKEFLHEQSLFQAKSLTQTLSKNATSWVLANDFIGMEEIVQSISSYPNLKYAMLLDNNGKVLAHTNQKFVNKYLSDTKSKLLFKSLLSTQILLNSNSTIDLAVMIKRGDQLIGWARVALSKDSINSELNSITNNGLIYTFAAIFVSAFFSYIIAIGLTKSLYELIDIAKKRSKGSSDLRAYVNRSDEVGMLAYEINIMLDKIEDEVEANRQKDNMIFQQSKMAAMGEMIENIAHQWRQPISIIAMWANNMMVDIDMGEINNKDLNRYANDIVKQTQHLSQTIDDFRNFFSPNKEKTKFNIKSSVDKTMELVSASFKTHNIEVIKDIEDIEIITLENELKQAILNIIKNAKDILLTLEGKKRFIFIKTYIKADKSRVVIEIKDSGGGVAENIIDQIFEPYFTTKHKSQGTGIGLYMTQSIITKHLHGDISVNNVEYEYEGKLYKGAKFTIEIPLEYKDDK